MPERAKPDDHRADLPPRPDRAARPNILTSLQIDTPLEEFRRHCEKKQRSFEGATEKRASEIYRRAFELAENLLRRRSGEGGPC